MQVQPSRNPTPEWPCYASAGQQGEGDIKIQAGPLVRVTGSQRMLEPLLARASMAGQGPERVFAQPAMSARVAAENV